jgi:hypothetical protein
MKKKQTKNNSNFNREEVNRWFGDNLFCWWCNKNGWNAGHHICGRHGKYKNSLLNYAPVHNQECHLDIHPKLRKTDSVKKLLQKTVSYLLDSGYEFNENDKMFLYENRDFYVVKR